MSSDVGGLSCGATCTTTRLPLPTTINLTAVAAVRSVLAGFTGGGCSASPMCSVMVTSDTTITARFDSIPMDSGATDSGAETDVVTDGAERDDAIDDHHVDDSAANDGAIDADIRDARVADTSSGDARMVADAQTSSDGSAADASTGRPNAGCACTTGRTSNTARAFAVLLSAAGVLLARGRRRRDRK